MIPNLQNLCAYVCTSLLFNCVIRGHNGQIDGDMTSLKRGIRYQDNLHNHEIIYRALQKNGSLGAFQSITQRCGSVSVSGGLDFKKMAEKCLEYADTQTKQADYMTSQGMGDSAAYYYRIAEEQRDKVEVYRFLENFSADIIAESKLDCYNKVKLIHWDDLTSIKFYKYDAQTNSFQPFDHRTKKRGK